MGARGLGIEKLGCGLAVGGACAMIHKRRSGMSGEKDVFRVTAELGLRTGCKDPLAIHLGAYGRKVFGALRRTRKARPVWRQKAMAKLDAWAFEHGLPPEPFARMKQAVIALFADMERKGELD